MKSAFLRLKGALIAIVVLAFSASIAFGASPPEAAQAGLANAANHAGKTVPVAGGQAGTTGEVEGTEEEEPGTEEEEAGTEEEGAEEAGDHCLTDPTALTDEELAAMNHGSIVCWAAHQETWPEEFKNHGAWVSSWAHAGKADPETAKVKGDGKGQGKAKGHANKP